MFALLIAVVAATASPSPPPLTAQQLYEGAIARLAALRQAPYLSYEMDQTGYTREQGIIFDLGSKIIERRNDRSFHNVSLYGDDNVIEIGRHYLTPDAFIPNAGLSVMADGTLPTLDTPAPVAIAASNMPSPAASATAPSTLRIIATVHTVASYVLTDAGDQTIANGFCGTAAHILLKPKHDSDVFNVREMWIRRSDFALCAAIFNSRAFSAYGDLRSIDAAWLDERGFITHWRAQFLPNGNYDAGTFKNIEWLDTVPSGTFFSR